MHYPKKLREATVALVECCQLIGGYVGHYGRLERNHPLFNSMRDLTLSVAHEQNKVFERSKRKKPRSKVKATLKKIKKVEPALQRFLRGD